MLYGGLFTFATAFIAAVALRFPIGHKDGMEFCDDERAYPYNVETGDLSDLQKLAQYRVTWD